MLDSSVRRLFNDIQPMKNFPRTGKKVVRKRPPRASLPLRQVPQTKPEAREDPRPLVLPEVPRAEESPTQQGSPTQQVAES